MISWSTRFRLRERYEQSWLVIPGLYLIAALALGALVPLAEESRDLSVGPVFDPDSARNILQAIAGGMLTFTALVVSVAVMVVQFAAGQYSPRLVLRFRRGPAFKHSLGIFVAPALYALVAIGSIGAPGGPEEPSLTVTVGLLTVVGAIIAFFLLIARLLDLLRPRRLFHQVVGWCEQATDEVYPEPFSDSEPVGEWADEPVSKQITWRGSDGVLSGVDLAALVEEARRLDVGIELVVRIGEYVHRDEPVLLVHGAGWSGDPRRLLRSVVIAEERTMTQDPSYAIRTLVDIAIRALSPAINDPTTAVQGIDGLESILRLLATRDLGSGQLADDAGVVRVVYPAATWEELLDLALTEIRHYGGNAPQVTRRLRAVLLGLEATVPEPRRSAVVRQLERLDATIEANFPVPAERALARVADHTGLGGRVDEPRVESLAQ